VHGCFWHRHVGCKNSVLPKTRADFWLDKLNGNAKRDRRNRAELKRQGWKTLIVWECAVDDETALTRRLVAELTGTPHD
jgi:DNA mismatch endonuclease (patch repair protein)